MSPKNIIDGVDNIEIINPTFYNKGKLKAKFSVRLSFVLMGTPVKLTLPNIKAFDGESGLGLEYRARYEKVVKKGKEETKRNQDYFPDSNLTIEIKKTISHFLNKVETD